MQKPTSKASRSARNSARAKLNTTISLAFLSPNIVRAAIEGRLPRGLGVTGSRDAPVEWSRQHAMLGLPVLFAAACVISECRARTGSQGVRDKKGEKACPTQMRRLRERARHTTPPILGQFPHFRQSPRLRDCVVGPEGPLNLQPDRYERQEASRSWQKSLVFNDFDAPSTELMTVVSGAILVR